MKHTYSSLSDAKNALALDCGFDPFLHGGIRSSSDGKIYRRATKTALAALGYPIVHPTAEQKSDAPATQSYRCECDHGHTWRTDDPQRDVKCPTCGEYWV